MKTETRIFPSRIEAALVLSTFALVALLAGCGTTPLVLKASDPQIDFSQYKSVMVETTGQGSSISSSAQARIKDLVKAEILACCAPRFESVTVDAAQPHDLILRVKLTIYDEGNRFARFMLAGLGSMQIHAQVEIAESKSGNLLTSGEAGKTFAWGGVYGASVGIEDLEKDFAKEVVIGLRETLRIEGSTP
jgi:hypothetical protein